MYRRYPAWLRAFITIALLVNLSQWAMAAVPSIKDDCAHHCQTHHMSMDMSHKMNHSQGHHHDGSCCDGMQACGHCSSCSLVPLMMGVEWPAMLISAQTLYPVLAVHPIGLTSPPHEHPPRYTPATAI